MTAAQAVEMLAQEIYWAAYDGYIDSSYKHPLGLTPEQAWARISDEQREYCRHQAARVLGRLVAEELFRMDRATPG